MHDTVQIQRANRVAIASSLYMRKSSLDLRQSLDLRLYENNPCKSHRQQSFGKIIKNNKRQNDEELKIVKAKQLFNQTIHNSCLHDKKNIIDKVQIDKLRKTPIFSMIDNCQNSKIKTIQQKYAAMLTQYQKKKDNISKEIIFMQQKNSVSSARQLNYSKQNKQFKHSDIQTNKHNKLNPSQRVFNKAGQQLKGKQCSIGHSKHEVVKPALTTLMENSRPYPAISKKGVEQAYTSIEQRINKKMLNNSQMLNSMNIATGKDGLSINSVRKMQHVENSRKQQQIDNRKQQQIDNRKQQIKNSRLAKYTQKTKLKHHKFLSAIQSQIQCEQKLRNLKQQFANKSQPFRNNFKKLCQKQAAMCIDIDDIVAEQLDPFYISNQKWNSYDMDIFIRQFKQLQMACVHNWDSRVVGCINAEQAVQVFKCLDYQNSKEISLKNLVREISLSLGRNYRNRDLYRIHCRFRPMTQHRFKAMFDSSVNKQHNNANSINEQSTKTQTTVEQQATKQQK